MSQARIEQTCTVFRKGRGRRKRSENAQGVWEHERAKGDLQQKMRHPQKTKGALLPFRNDCVKSVPVYITAQMLEFWSRISDELYQPASLHHGHILHKACDFDLKDSTVVENWDTTECSHVFAVSKMHVVWSVNGGCSIFKLHGFSYIVIENPPIHPLPYPLCTLIYVEDISEVTESLQLA